MPAGLSITPSQDIQASNFVCCPIVGTVNADITSGESKWSGPRCSNRRTVPQLKRCPRGGQNFCKWGRKIEQVSVDLRKPKQKLNSKLYITPGSLLIFKKKKKVYPAKLVWSA